MVCNCFGICKGAYFSTVIYCKLGGAAKATVCACYEGYGVLVDLVNCIYGEVSSDVAEVNVPVLEGVAFYCRCFGSGCGRAVFYGLFLNCLAVCYEGYGVLIDLVNCGYGEVSSLRDQ